MTTPYFQDHALALNGRSDGVRIPRHDAYDFKTGDFTIEVWMRGRGMGSLVARASTDDKLKQGEGRFELSLDQHGIRFEASSFEEKTRRVTSRANVRTGRWHHIAAVRKDRRVSILLDGRVLPLEGDPEMRHVLQTKLPLLIGQSTYFSRALEQNKEITQVRIWNHARTAADIEALMYHQLGGREPGLVGLWNFDSRDFRDSSPLGNHGKAEGGATTRATDMSLYPFGKPYLTVQTRLMQDYDAAGKEITAYRVVLAPHGEDGALLATKVDVYAEREVDAAVQDKPVRLSTTAPCTAVPNALGQISIAIPASADALSAPLLKVRPHFIENAAERIVVAPDRHLHAVMAQATAKQYRGEHDPGSLFPDLTPVGGKPALVAEAKADAVQKAVQNFMQGVSEEQVMAATPHDELLLLAAGRTLAQESPTPSWVRLPAPFRRTDDASRIGWQRDTDAGVRVVAAERMETPHFELDFANGSFTALTLEAAAASSVTEGTVVYGDPIAAALASAPRRADGVVELDLASFQRLHQEAVAHVSSASWNLFDLFRDAVRVIVRTVTQVVHEIGKVIQTIVVRVIDAAKRAVEVVLDLVSKAIEAVRGVFAAAGAATHKVRDFFRSIFDWNDIALVQAAVSNFADQTLQRMTMYVADARRSTNSALDRVRTEASKAIRDHAATLSGVRFSGVTQPRSGGGSSGVQGSWVGNRVMNSSGEWAPKLQPGFANGRLESFGSEVEAAEARSKDVHAKLEALEGSDALAVARVLEAFVTGSIDLIQRVTDALFEIVESNLTAFRNILNTRIDIPIITKLFEETILPGRKLTLLNAFALVIAVPATVTYKAARGGAFDDRDRKAFRFLAEAKADAMDWLRAPKAGAVPPAVAGGPPMTDSDLNVVAGALGVLCTIGLASYGVIQFMDDLATARKTDFAAMAARGGGAFLFFFSLAFSLPLNADIILRGKAPSASHSFAAGVFGYAVNCCVFGAYLLALMDTFLERPAGKLRLFEKVLIFTNFLAGVLLGLQSIWLTLALAAENGGALYGVLFLQNFVLTLPLTAQITLLARDLPPPYNKAALISPALTAGGFGVGCATLLGRSVHQVTTRQDDFRFFARG